MATKTKEESVIGVVIPEIQINTMTVKVIGDSPLIIHNWDEKAKKEMLAKQMKEATTGKEAKVPMRDFVNSLYWIDDDGFEIGTPESLKNMDNNTPFEEVQKEILKGKFGFKSCGFKAAAIDAGFQQGILAKKTTARGCFHIDRDYVQIHGIPVPREDMVRIVGTTDIRYRGMFESWWAELTIKYNPKSMSASQIINLLNLGGFCNGVGEWRPSRDGSFGRFHVETEK